MVRHRCQRLAVCLRSPAASLSVQRLLILRADVQCLDGSVLLQAARTSPRVTHAAVLTALRPVAVQRK